MFLASRQLRPARAVTNPIYLILRDAAADKQYPPRAWIEGKNPNLPSCSRIASLSNEAQPASYHSPAQVYRQRIAGVALTNISHETLEGETNVPLAERPDRDRDGSKPKDRPRHCPSLWRNWLQRAGNRSRAGRCLKGSGPRSRKLAGPQALVMGD